MGIEWDKREEEKKKEAGRSIETGMSGDDGEGKPPAKEVDLSKEPLPPLATEERKETVRQEDKSSAIEEALRRTREEEKKTE